MIICRITCMYHFSKIKQQFNGIDLFTCACIVRTWNKWDIIRYHWSMTWMDPILGSQWSPSYQNVWIYNCTVLSFINSFAWVVLPSWRWRQRRYIRARIWASEITHTCVAVKRSYRPISARQGKGQKLKKRKRNFI